MLPQGLKYSKENMWVFIKGERAKIGITEFFLEKAKEIVGVSLPKKGEDVDKDEVFGGLDTSEQVIDLISPLSGEVIRVNNLVLNEPEVIVEDPYGDGWLIEIDLYEPEETEELLDIDEYERLIE
ncbi:MAG: glycine cleavage system protein H [Proteobacteria bacterium]|nr:glycine cleavage system protein H [Pseudomonadota bacterium]